MFYHPEIISRMLINDGIAPAEEQANQLCTLPVQTNGSVAAHRTLIPVDESQGASNALKYVIRAAQKGSTSEIHLINVQPLILVGEFALDEIVQIEKRARLAVGEQVIKRARRLLDKNGIACKKATVRFGRPAMTIVQYAREQCIDAIVMGMRSRSLISRLLRRSVAADVTRMADVPVTILRSHNGSGITLQGNPLDGLRPVAMQ